MADPTLLRQAQRSRTTGSSSCSPSTRTTTRSLDELFLATLARLPTDEGAGSRSPKHRQTSKDRRDGVHRHAVGADQHARVYAESLTVVAASSVRRMPVTAARRESSQLNCTTATVFAALKGETLPAGIGLRPRLTGRGTLARERTGIAMATHCMTDCEGFYRRDFLKIGAAGLFGLSLPQLLQLEAQARAGTADDAEAQGQRRHPWSGSAAARPPSTCGTSSPNAPEGIRGEFKPIDTKVDGVQISEHLPKMAAGHGQGAPSSARCTTPSRRTARPRSS